MYATDYNSYLKESSWNFLKIYKNIFIIEELETAEGFKKWVINRKLTHAPMLEFLWVILPTIILGFIIYPSIILLYSNENFADPILNISVIGNQWFWTYEYNDFHIPTMFLFYMEKEELTGYWRGVRTFRHMMEHTESRYVHCRKNMMHDWSTGFHRKSELPERISFDSNMIIAKDTSKFPRLLTTDNVLVLPTKTPIRLLITSNDVIHSWAVPSYGVKVDAIPGRINQQLLFVPLMGRAWGQCSELCGVNHGFMPIEIKALPRPEFNQFIYLKFLDVTTEARKEYFMFQLHRLQGDIKFLEALAEVLPQIHRPDDTFASNEEYRQYLDDLTRALEMLIRAENPFMLSHLEDSGIERGAIREIIDGKKSLKEVIYATVDTEVNQAHDLLLNQQIN